MSGKPIRRKCRCCRKFFSPDYRNKHHQHYCPAAACRKVSKVASQRRWRQTKFGRGYSRGEDEVRRVQEWRRAHSGYWKKQKSRSEKGQAAETQPVNPDQTSRNVPRSDLRTLQDFCLSFQPECRPLAAAACMSLLPARL